MDNSSAFSDQDRNDLKRAKALLEQPSLAVKVVNWLGEPIEWSLNRLPKTAKDSIDKATQSALDSVFALAVKGMEDKPGKGSSSRQYLLMNVGGGAIGGFFGMAGLPIELPFTTGLILRSTMDIARSEGEAIQDPEVKINCLTVFALGGVSKSDDAGETSYYTIRTGLAAAQKYAVEQLAKEGVKGLGLEKFIQALGKRFGVQVTEKAVGQSIPLVGAFGGALVNGMFTDHFQCAARGHFIVRRLEKVHGQARVKQEYEALQ